MFGLFEHNYHRTYYVYMYVCVCMYVCMYVCIYVCMYVYVDVYVYVLDGPGIESRWRRDFLHPPDRLLSTTAHPIKWVLDFFCG